MSVLDDGEFGTIRTEDLPVTGRDGHGEKTPTVRELIAILRALPGQFQDLPVGRYCDEGIAGISYAASYPGEEWEGGSTAHVRLWLAQGRRNLPAPDVTGAHPRRHRLLHAARRQAPGGARAARHRRLLPVRRARVPGGFPRSAHGCLPVTRWRSWTRTVSAHPCPAASEEGIGARRDSSAGWLYQRGEIHIVQCSDKSRSAGVI